MSAQELITEHLDLWTSATTHTTNGRGNSGKTELVGLQKLRELILELAIRGELIEQTPENEPASLLLERVHEEKRQLIHKGEIRKTRKLPSRLEMETPFGLPAGWEWAQLEDIGRDWGQTTPDQTISYIDVSSIDSTRGTITEPTLIPPTEAPSRARKIVRKGTLIYSTVRPYLQNIAVIDREINPKPIASTAFAVLHPIAEISARYLLHYLRSPTFVRYVESVQTGIAYPAINDKQFFSGLVPIPPLQEQYRIVQKVDELMALCDRLEQQTSDQLEAHETLVDTLLNTLTQSENATELADNWARLAEHFDTLFTTEQSIDKLKQTILQLAVMGRLVEQDSEEEPASDLLEKLNSAREALIQSGDLKKARKLPAVSGEEINFPVPSGWAVARLADVYDVRDGTHDSPRYQSSGFPLITSKNLSTGELCFENVKLISKADHLKIQERSKVDQGDILFAMIGSIGNPVLVNTDREFSIKNVALFKYYSRDLSDPNYLRIFLENAATELKLQASGGVQSFVSLGKLRSWPMPLPPLGEQCRIVQKVDELMALCDQLAQNLSQASQTRCQLAEVVVEGALN